MTKPFVSFTVELASVPDRDDLVAEVWLGDELLAELRHEAGGVHLQLYNASALGRWDLPLDDLLAALQTARERLGPAPLEDHDGGGFGSS